MLRTLRGERFAVPTKKPGLAKVYARHVAEGGTPYDDRGRHLTTLIEEYNKMVGFVRATKSGEFNESVQRVVNAGIDHYQSLRESLGKLTSHRGYHNYFDSWSPVLNEEQSDITEISTLFTKSNLDPRIESCIPILSKLTKLDETKPVKELDSWADEVIRETTSIDLSKEGPTPLMPGAGKNTRTSRERDRERAKALSHYSKELAAHHYGNELNKSDQGVAEGIEQEWEVSFDYGPHQSERINVKASSKEEAIAKVKEQAKKSPMFKNITINWAKPKQQGVAEGSSERAASERAERAWNRGKRGEDFIKQFGKSEFDRLTKKSSERADRAWNGGVSDEDFIKQFGKSEFDRYTKKYGDGSIPVPDLHGYTPREPTDPKVRLHRGLDGPGAKLKSIIKKVNDQGVAESKLNELVRAGMHIPHSDDALRPRTQQQRDRLATAIKQTRDYNRQNRDYHGQLDDISPEEMRRKNFQARGARSSSIDDGERLLRTRIKNPYDSGGTVGAAAITSKADIAHPEDPKFPMDYRTSRWDGRDPKTIPSGAKVKMAVKPTIQGVAEGARDKVHLITPKFGLADHPGRNTGVGQRTFAQTPEQDRCSKCNTLYKNHYKKGVAEGLAPGQSAWKKEMIAKGAVSFKRDQHGGGAVDRIIAYDKDGNVVGGFNRKGVAEGSKQQWEVSFDYGPHMSDRVIVTASTKEEAAKKGIEAAKKQGHRYPMINWARPVKQGVAEGEVVEFSLPKAIQNLALEWVEYTFLEDGPEQKRIENELSKKGFGIDFSDDGNALLLTHSKTGKEFLVQIPEKMQELAESWDEDSYIERRRARKYGYDTGLEREYRDLEDHERAMAARAAKEKEKTSSQEHAPDDSEDINEEYEKFTDSLKKLFGIIGISGAIGYGAWLDHLATYDTPLVHEIVRQAQAGDPRAIEDLRNISLRDGSTVELNRLLNRYGFRSEYERRKPEDTHEGLNAQQKAAGQLGPTEKAKNISPVLGSPQHKHPFDGKLVGNESADPDLKRLQALINHIR